MKLESIRGCSLHGGEYRGTWERPWWILANMWPDWWPFKHMYEVFRPHVGHHRHCWPNSSLVEEIPTPLALPESLLCQLWICTAISKLPLMDIWLGSELWSIVGFQQLPALDVPEEGGTYLYNPVLQLEKPYQVSKHNSSTSREVFLIVSVPHHTDDAMLYEDVIPKPARQCEALQLAVLLPSSSTCWS